MTSAHPGRDELDVPSSFDPTYARRALIARMMPATPKNAANSLARDPYQDGIVPGVRRVNIVSGEEEADLDNDPRYAAAGERPESTTVVERALPI